MGGKSRSTTQQQQQTTTTNVQDIDTTTVGLEDVQESNVALGNQTITQISTDQGAVEAGRAIGESALDFAGEFGGVALETVSDATERALDFGEASQEEAFGFGGQALDFGEASQKAAFGFGGQALDFGGKALAAVSAQSASTTKELGAAIGRAAEATRSDSAVVTQNIAKTGAIVVGVVVLGVVVVVLFRRK